ncbi:uncharacterized protein SETTUDRAFT_30649 [Exserohilum turcica Et28A]|uniref:Uncharacterized protein n=1 Tax=Exserohilum turcicum (strain 28A) TaxID=671987 RepID=R0KWW7_EXST2|nr:uncharacterized protein SETTUDRAFT_30649 [Exserohilum turcica Et28A]EOA92182.1 hypothetical protein SETTUDRAFT_30649 [Exserohilum turcica Et28A]
MGVPTIDGPACVLPPADRAAQGEPMFLKLKHHPCATQARFEPPKPIAKRRRHLDRTTPDRLDDITPPRPSTLLCDKLTTTFASGQTTDWAVALVQFPPTPAGSVSHGPAA